MLSTIALLSCMGALGQGHLHSRISGNIVGGGRIVVTVLIVIIVFVVMIVRIFKIGMIPMIFIFVMLS